MTIAMNLEALYAQQTGAVLHITLNRPALRNAMSLQMVVELRAVLANAEAAGSVRVIVLRGAGGHFCAGADLQDMAAARMRSMRDASRMGEAGVAIDAVAQAN